MGGRKKEEGPKGWGAAPAGPEPASPDVNPTLVTGKNAQAHRAHGGDNITAIMDTGEQHTLGPMAEETSHICLNY